jgi:hypothetical protein
MNADKSSGNDARNGSESGMLPNTNKPWEKEKAYRCPCCRYKTLHGRGQYEICKVCFWEDDGQDDHDASDVRGGPNYELSLTRARENFKDFKASRRRSCANVRPPKPDEI